jgi:hypothetical protein
MDVQDSLGTGIATEYATVRSGYRDRNRICNSTVWVQGSQQNMQEYGQAPSIATNVLYHTVHGLGLWLARTLHAFLHCLDKRVAYNILTVGVQVSQQIVHRLDTRVKKLFYITSLHGPDTRRARLYAVILDTNRK